MLIQEIQPLTKNTPIYPQKIHAEITPNVPSIDINKNKERTVKIQNLLFEGSLIVIIMLILTSPIFV